MTPDERAREITTKMMLEWENRASVTYAEQEQLISNAIRAAVADERILLRGLLEGVCCLQSDEYGKGWADCKEAVLRALDAEFKVRPIEKRIEEPPKAATTEGYCTCREAPGCCQIHKREGACTHNAVSPGPGKTLCLEPLPCKFHG